MTYWGMKMRLLISTLLILGNLALIAQEAKFTASAPKTVIQGTRFQLVYSIDQEASDLRVPNIPDFQVLMGPSTATSSQVSIINGQVSRATNYSFTYILKIDKTGTFTIPPATIEVDGRQVASNALTIEVIQNDGSSQQNQGQKSQASPDEAVLSDDDLYITMNASKTEAYQDEPILITTRIFTKVNLEGISDIKNPELRNFVVEELDSQVENIQWSVQNINGKTYRVGVYSQKVVYAQASGKLYIEPISIEFLLRQRAARQSQSIFDDFFESYRTVKRRVSSKGININVKPLPTPVPASFSGIVGDVKLNVTASATEAKVNDGITIKTVVTGTGNIRLAKNPEIKFPSDFDVFDPKITNNVTQTAQGGRGDRITETLIIPRHAGDFEVPAVEYTFFNPSQGRYQTLTSSPIALKIGKSGPEDTMSPTSSPGIASTRENVKYIGQDIRFIKTASIQLKPKNTFLFGSTLYVLGFLLPLLAFIAIFLLFRKRIKENADLQMVRNRKANKMALKRLKKSEFHLKKGDKAGFYEELSRALWGYASDKLSIPQSELNRDNSRAILIECGASDETTADFLDILDTCEYARYAPQSEHHERDYLYKRAVETISKLESQLKKKVKL
jgi:hypothetical protein